MATYRQAGVDIEAGERLVDAISSDVTSTWTDNVVGGFGGFAAGIEIPAGYANPVLMMSTDGVGTKIEVAKQAGRIDGLGHDLVAMCVDDLAAVGARPLAFTDYLATGRIDPERDRTLVASIAAGCRTAGCALLGGETAEHPGVMGVDQFDLAGAALGVVDRDQIVDGSAIRVDDVVVGVHSPNLRSNGFSLIRAIFDESALGEGFPGEPERTVGDVLSEPSVIYSPAISQILATGGVTGLAHITGGGLPGNAARPLPDGVGVRIDTRSWLPPSVFGFVSQEGNISLDEMFKTFNMGIGFVVYTAPGSTDEIRSALARAGHNSSEIGQVTAGQSTVTLEGLVSDH